MCWGVICVRRTERQREAIGDRRGSDLFKDRGVFESDYLPEKIHPREAFRKVAGFLRRCIDGGSAHPLLLVGPNGVGKTLVARYYGVLARCCAGRRGVKFEVLYVNCRDISSAYGFWRMLLSKVSCKVSRGLSLSHLARTLFEQQRSSCR